VVLFLAPKADEEPRLEAFELEAPLPLFAKDVVRDAVGTCGMGRRILRLTRLLLLWERSAMCVRET